MDETVDPAESEWRLVREEARSGPMNMALDEIAAETAASGGPRTVRVYRWEPSTLSLGYRQDPDTVDWEHCADAGVTVTRRQTGGGGIYHDAFGDISYSIIAPKDELPGSLMEAYALLCEPVLEAFERMGVPAHFAESERPELYSPACYLRELHPAHDVVVGGPEADARGDDARKISGNAQYRRRDAVIQHGSLTYAVDAEAHLAVFDEPTGRPADFRDRVTSIENHADVTRAEAVGHLESALADWADAEEGSWTDDELALARERAAEKYATDEWTRRRPNA